MQSRADVARVVSFITDVLDRTRSRTPPLGRTLRSRCRTEPSSASPTPSFTSINESPGNRRLLRERVNPLSISRLTAASLDFLPSLGEARSFTGRAVCQPLGGALNNLRPARVTLQAAQRLQQQLDCLSLLNGSSPTDNGRRTFPAGLQDSTAMLRINSAPTSSCRAADMAANPPACRPAAEARGRPEQTVLYCLVDPLWACQMVCKHFPLVSGDKPQLLLHPYPSMKAQ